MVKFTQKSGHYKDPLYGPGQTGLNYAQLRRESYSVWELVDQLKGKLDFYKRMGVSTLRNLPSSKTEALSHDQKIWRRYMVMGNLENNASSRFDQQAWKNSVIGSDVIWRDLLFSEYFGACVSHNDFSNYTHLFGVYASDNSCMIAFTHHYDCYCDLYYRPGLDPGEESPIIWHHKAFEQRGMRSSGRVDPHWVFPYVTSSQPVFAKQHVFWLPFISGDSYPMLFALRLFDSAGRPYGSSGLYCQAFYLYTQGPGPPEELEADSGPFHTTDEYFFYIPEAYLFPSVPPLEANVWEK